MGSHDEEEAEQRTSPTGEVVYKAICTEGESELERSTSALAWSGLAAGLSMAFSLITSALIHAHTPATKFQPMLTALGYPIGFLIVVLGRQQLFTENTLTVMLPLFRERSSHALGNVARVWVVVLAANTVGAIAIAFVLARTQALSPAVVDSMHLVSRHVFEHPFLVTMLRGIFAGWLIALMVWLLPFAEEMRVVVIGVITYIVGLAQFSHIIAGSVDGAFLVFASGNSWSDFFLRFYVPALIGNILGGVLLVAAINHAQVVAGGNGVDA